MNEILQTIYSIEWWFSFATIGIFLPILVNILYDKYKNYESKNLSNSQKLERLKRKKIDHLIDFYVKNPQIGNIFIIKHHIRNILFTIFIMFLFLFVAFAISYIHIKSKDLETEIISICLCFIFYMIIYLFLRIKQKHERYIIKNVYDKLTIEYELPDIKIKKIIK